MTTAQLKGRLNRLRDALQGIERDDPRSFTITLMIDPAQVTFGLDTVKNRRWVVIAGTTIYDDDLLYNPVTLQIQKQIYANATSQTKTP